MRPKSTRMLWKVLSSRTRGKALRNFDLELGPKNLDHSSWTTKFETRNLDHGVWTRNLDPRIWTPVGRSEFQLNTQSSQRPKHAIIEKRPATALPKDKTVKNKVNHCNAARLGQRNEPRAAATKSEDLQEGLTQEAFAKQISVTKQAPIGRYRTIRRPKKL